MEDLVNLSNLKRSKKKSFRTKIVSIIQTNAVKTFYWLSEIFISPRTKSYIAFIISSTVERTLVACFCVQPLGQNRSEWARIEGLSN